MNPTTLIIGGVGALLIYAAVKDKDPRSIIAEAFQPRSKRRAANPNPNNNPVVVPGAPTYTGDPRDYFGNLPNV